MSQPTAIPPDSWFVGRTVIDDRGAAVGTVVRTIREPGGPRPSWLVVDRGRWRAQQYVPVDGAYPTVEGEVGVPFDKAWVRAAPKVDDGSEVSGRLTYETRRNLATHYGDRYEWWPHRYGPQILAV